MRRIFTGGLATETNTFSPIPTGYDDFRTARADDPAELRATVFFGTSFRAYAEVAAARDVELVQGRHSWAVPAGPPPRSVYERLRDELLGELEQALPVDGVLLTLHGAMVSEGYDDCETDIVERVRAFVGPSATIGVLLDPHCDLPRRLIDAADAVVVIKEYPHVDVEDRARQLAGIVVDAIEGRAAPAMALFDCRMVGFYPTPRQPMRGFVDEVLYGAEREDDVLAVSLGHGFQYMDSPEGGARALVISDGDPARAALVAERVGRAFYALRHEVTLVPLPLEEGLDAALAAPHTSKPVVLADTADNAGGGAPSDSTFILRELLRRDVRGVGLGPLWDPIAVRLAFAAETGATLTLRLGGKLGPASGDPLDVTARVKGLVRNLVQLWPQANGSVEVPTGDAACLEVGGVDVIVVSVREQAFGLELFTAFGLDPAAKRLLVLKSANHFRAAYDRIAQDVLYVEAPGALPGDPRRVTYTRMATDKFPWVDDPLAGD